MTSSDAPALDKVYLSPRVIERIKRGALLYPDEETGEALVGVVLPEKEGEFPAMVVLETIPPMQYVVRKWAMFSQGDDWQGAIFNWLNANWEVYRDLRRRNYGRSAKAKWDLPLMHLGDWHKQPGMVAPSGADFHTAKDFLRESKTDFILTPIVTLADEADAPIEANTLVWEDVNPALRLDFWGIGRRSRDFIPLEPVLSAGYGLPRLPDVVWWLDDSSRLDDEITALEDGGFDVLDIAQHNADGMPPLETCFTIYRPGTTRVILAITPHTYPKKAPEWRIAPLLRPDEKRDWFEMLFAASHRVEIRGWSGDLHGLLEGVRMIEKEPTP